MAEPQNHDDAMSLTIGVNMLHAMADAGVILLIARADLVQIIYPNQEAQDDG